MITENTYAILTADHDCDGITYALYSVKAFAEQTYFGKSEGTPISRATFYREYRPVMNAFDRSYWESEGYCNLSRTSR